MFLGDRRTLAWLNHDLVRIVRKSDRKHAKRIGLLIQNDARGFIDNGDARSNRRSVRAQNITYESDKAVLRERALSPKRENAQQWWQ